jgi:hypothetical protein
MSIIRELADYYVARLASQYRLQTKAPAHVGLFAKQMLADALALAISPAFDINIAQGQQLDIIGKYVGAARDVQVPDTRAYFGFVSYNYPTGTQNPNGFVSYASLAINAEGNWFEYEFEGLSTSQLTDFAYRQLLLLKVFTNSSNNTMEAIQKQIASFFPGQLQIRDNLDMTLTYFYGSSFQLPLSVLTGALPRPMGVRVTAVEAVGFDIALDGVPSFNSDTQAPVVNFGSVLFQATVVFTITNTKGTTLTITSITSSNPIFAAVASSPALPATLAKGQSVAITVNASSATAQTNATTDLTISYSSTIELGSYVIPATVTIEGVSLNFRAFDNFDGYSDGALNSPWDSWGWAAVGSSTNMYPVIPQDNFSSYADGPLPTPSGGLNWLAAGSSTHYANA